MAVVTGKDELTQKTAGNIMQIEVRDGPVIIVTNSHAEVVQYVDAILEASVGNPQTAPLLGKLLFGVDFFALRGTDTTIEFLHNSPKIQSQKVLISLVVSYLTLRNSLKSSFLLLS